MAAINCIKEFCKRKFEKKCLIRNWEKMAPNHFIGRNKIEFNLQAEKVEYAKILVLITFNYKDSFRFSWTVLSKHECLDNKEAYLVAEILKSDGTAVRYEVQASPIMEKTYRVHTPILDSSSGDSGSTSWNNAEGLVEINLRCILTTLSLHKLMKFRHTCQSELRLNLASALEDKTNSDVKIITKDNAELFAHKVILEARCPVFASMFRSGFLESSTGIVNVHDISAKTMKSLLNYWYTGNLMVGWTDDDTFVEFAYAAGKYQITPVLKMLDEILGSDYTVSVLEVELLKVTHQLSLSNAEARILKRIINKISKAKSGAEVLDFFSIPLENFDESGFTAPQIFQACNDVMHENDDKVANYQDIKLMALACSFGMRNVEAKILKRVVYTVSKISNAEDLFVLFNLQK